MNILPIVNSLPAPVRDVLMEHPGKLVLAGGYIRAFINNEPMNDIDLFISGDKEAARKIAYALRHEATLPVSAVVETDNAFTVRGYSVAPQVIYRWDFACPQDVVAAFDFTISQACIWWTGTEWTDFRSPEFGDHVDAKVLAYTHPVGNNVGGSFSRLLKFSRMGYTTHRETVAEMMADMCRGMRVETLLGTESDLRDAFLGRLPKCGISG